MKVVRFDISAEDTALGPEVFFDEQDYDKLLKEFNEFKEKHGKVN